MGDDVLARLPSFRTFGGRARKCVPAIVIRDERGGNCMVGAGPAIVVRGERGSKAALKKRGGAIAHAEWVVDLIRSRDGPKEARRRWRRGEKINK